MTFRQEMFNERSTSHLLGCGCYFHHRPVRLNILGRLFDDTAFWICGDRPLIRFSLELLSTLDPDVDRARLDRSDCARMSSRRTSSCGELV
jgi:hypothetical protein